MNFDVKVTQSQRWYVISFDNGRLYIISRKALKWNLSNVFLLSSDEVQHVMFSLDEVGVATFNLPKQKAS